MQSYETLGKLQHDKSRHRVTAWMHRKRKQSEPRSVQCRKLSCCAVHANLPDNRQLGRNSSVAQLASLILNTNGLQNLSFLGVFLISKDSGILQRERVVRIILQMYGQCTLGGPVQMFM